MNETKALYLRLYNLLKNNESVITATIIKSEGSTPRGVGAKMLVAKSGTYGTIGGGVAEYYSQKYALTLLDKCACDIREFVMSPNDAASIGMICGGQILVYFQYYSPDDEENLQALKHALYPDNSDGQYIITKLNYINHEGIILGDDFGFSLSNYSPNTNSENTSMEQILPSILGKPVYIEQENIFIEPLSPSITVHIFGAGHIARSLAPLLTGADFDVAVFDDREEFADSRFFPPECNVSLCDFTHIKSVVSFENSDYIIIMTHGHQNDFEVLLQALISDAAYIGMIGSRAKIATTKKRVIEAGFSESDFDRVYTPIGLTIGAVTPNEIAISIAAELIKTRAGLAK